MANRLTMAKVHPIRTLHQRGWSNRRIARELGIHRKTVGRYVRLFEREQAKAASNPPPGSAGCGLGEGWAGLPLTLLYRRAWRGGSRPAALFPRGFCLRGAVFDLKCWYSHR